MIFPKNNPAAEGCDC